MAGPWVFCSCKGKTFAFCMSCKVDFNFLYEGISDIRKRLATVKHQQLVKAANNGAVLRNFIHESPIEDAVTRSEVLFANFIAEHNLSFSTVNHFSHLTHVMFPDSKIAQAFKSARTKTKCIIKHTLNPHLNPVIQCCQNVPFSILCDEDSSTEANHLAILVTLWDDNLGKPVSRFLDMPFCINRTGAKLFECTDESLRERSIS